MATACGSRLTAGPVIAPTVTSPARPVFRASARFREQQAGQGDAGVTDQRFSVPRRSHAARQSLEERDAEDVLQILEQLEAAGCDMFRISAARWMLPSSPIAISSISCRVLSRARRNQGVVVGMASFPHRYANHYIGSDVF